MEPAHKREMMVWLDGATDSQLQSKLLELQLAIDIVFTEPEVVADAKEIVRHIRAELLTRPTVRYLAQSQGT